MARRKVVLVSTENTPPPKRKKNLAGTPPKEQVSPLQDMLAQALKDASLSEGGLKMILEKVIQFFEEVIQSKNTTVDEYLCKMYADPQDKKHFAQLIEELWPGDDEIQYASDYSPGKKQFRPWMMGFHKMQGN